MEKEFGIPTRVDNDVRTAALGELNYGAGVGCENLVCITVGTGIGSGLVINGKLVRGADNAAGEIGHIKLNMQGGPLCGCGDRGCLEAYASGPSIVAMAEEYIRGGKSTKYRELANPDITPYIVAVAAKEGDPVAKQIFRIMGEYIDVYKRQVLMSAASTAFSFLLLSFTSFKLISSLGLTLFIGITASYILSLFMIKSNHGTR